MPLVSVIVPCYNHARFLEQRLDSVLRQTFGDFELILLDDASTDESRAIILRYLDRPNTRIVINEVNSGSPFAQWNRGVDLARGEFIWLAESDDFAEPTFLSNLVRLLQENPRAGIAYCQSWRTDANGKVDGDFSTFTAELGPARWNQPFANDGRDECRRFLLWKNTIPNASAVVFRRKTYLQAGKAPANMRLAGDWLTWARMLTISDVVFTPERLNYFRSHPNTTRALTGPRQFYDEHWQVQRHILVAGLVSPTDKNKIASTIAEEWLSRVRLASNYRAAHELLRGLRSYWPLIWRAPLPMGRVFFQRLVRKISK